MADTSIPDRAQRLLTRSTRRMSASRPRFRRLAAAPAGAHRVWGRALFKADAALARRCSTAIAQDHAPDAAALAAAIARSGLADRIYLRVIDKLTREPVEDFRIDFEDGFGNRPDQGRQLRATAASEVAQTRQRHPAALDRDPYQAAQRRVGRRSLRTFDFDAASRRRRKPAELRRAAEDHRRRAGDGARIGATRSSTGARCLPAACDSS
jgi:hypothetical protein